MKSDFGYTYDHDIAACAQCHLIDDYFQDGPCPECGHTFTSMATTYSQDEWGKTWKTFWCLATDVGSPSLSTQGAPFSRTTRPGLEPICQATGSSDPDRNS